MINPLIRQLSIDLITDTPNPIVEWFNDLWSKFSIIEIDVYHTAGNEFIYYIDGDVKQWIFYQDNRNDRFLCNYIYYWSILETKYNLKYSEIQELTKIIVENALNNVVPTPKRNDSFGRRIVENALNNGIPTPYRPSMSKRIEIENAINNAVPTPYTRYNGAFLYVENAINNGLSTPKLQELTTSLKVETALNNNIV